MKKILSTKIIYAVLACILSSAKLNAVIYYVSPSGNDNNSGLSTNNAWQTIAKVNSINIQPGTTILFQGGQTFSGGIYFNNTDANDFNNIVTISSYGNGRATISSGTVYGFYAYNTQGFTISNLNFVGAGMANNNTQGVYFFTDLGGNVKLKNIKVKNTDIRDYGKTGLIFGSSNNNTGYENLLIDSVHVYQVKENGISSWGYTSQAHVGWAHKNITIKHTEVNNVPGYSDPIGHKGSGIMLGQIDQALVENCYTHHNGSGNTACGGPGGIWAYDCNNVTFQFNESHHNYRGSGNGCDGLGFDFDGGITNSLMQYNYSHDNDGSGYLLGQYQNARPWYNNVIRYNISENDARTNEGGITLFKGPGTTMSGVKIYQNTVYITPSNANPYIGALTYINWQTGINDVKIYNNIFQTTGGVALVDVPAGYSAYFAGNLYWSTGGAFAIKYQGTTYNNLAAWRAATGNEQVGVTQTGITANPLLTNAGLGVNVYPLSPDQLNAYKLANNSPAINAGLNLQSLFSINSGGRDYFNNIAPTGAAPDIGVHESFTTNVTPTISANNGTICAGSSTVITANGATNYTWNPGALTGATQTLSPAITTIYTITGSNGIISSIKTITVTVNPTPTVTANNATICSGSSTVITASGAANYTWNPGGLTGATKTLSPLITTVYTITGSNGICSSNKTITVNVNTTPTVTANNANICNGGSAIATASGASGYTWNPGALIGASQTLSPGVTTMYTITGSNGTCSTNKTITVNVNTTPTVTANNANICNGGSAIVTASGASGYTWNPGALTGASQTLSPGVTTIYTITGSNGTCSSNKTITINVNTTPTVTANNANICSGSSTVITASGAENYTWNPGGLTGASQTLSPGVTTIYTITGSNGTCSSNKTITINVNTTPTVTANNANICNGGSAIATASGASTYIWYPGALNGANQTLSPLVTTVYTITGSNGTCSSNKTITVNVNPTPTISADNANICNGGSVIVTASGASGYTWNPGALTGASQTLSPGVTTIYTITGSNGTCSSNKTITVNVNTTPTVTANNANICNGGSAIVTASGASGYTWNPGALTGASQTLSPGVTTIYTITGSNGTCSSNKTITVNVNTTPTVTANNANICNGGSAIVTASGASGYTWNPGALTGASQTLSPGVTTIYTITGSNGTCSSNKTITVNVNTTPTVTANNANICNGSSTVVTASGASTYIWYPGALNGANHTLNPLVTTVYTITGSNGTCSSNKTITVNVNPSPTISANNATIVVGSPTIITASGANSYTWIPGSLTGASQTLNPGSTTVYTITGSNGSCSGSSTFTITVNDLPTGIKINKVNDDNISFFPNPVRPGEPVEIKVAALPFSVELFSISGASLFKDMEINSENYSISTGNYAKGIYVISITDGAGRKLLGKLIIH